LEIVVADKVEDRVHDRAFTESQQFRVALATLPYIRVRRRAAVSDRDDKAFADDQVGLAILDFLADQLAGSQHDEQHVVIDIQPGALVPLICVLDHQLVKAELGFEDAEQGLTELVQTEPDHAAIAAGQGADFRNCDITLPPPFPIKCAGDGAPLQLGGFAIDEVEHISRKP
jgi:hypothetical protein